MPLPYKCAMDSESDRPPGADVMQTRTCLVQICARDAVRLDDVILFFGVDALSQMLDSFEENVPTLRGTGEVDMRVFNLNYEWWGLVNALADHGYVFVDKKPNQVKRGEWSWIADDKCHYKICARNSHGVLLSITDDCRRMPGKMADVARAVYAQHPDWWAEVGEMVKDETDYHAGWLDPADPAYEQSIHYAKLDAFSQAMIMRYMDESGQSKNLTAPSNGFNFSLLMMYGGMEELSGLVGAEYDDVRKARWRYQKNFPPLGCRLKSVERDGKKHSEWVCLDPEMQMLAEKNITGGFVYGVPGTHRGTFCHVDYSSSYPFEYAYGELPEGPVVRCATTSPRYELLKNDEKLIRWFRVSFDFRIRSTGMPLLSGVDVACEENPMTGDKHKKIRSGHVSDRLYTESYLQELHRHYEIENLKVIEMWWAKKSIGPFYKVIDYLYNKKNELKREGKKDTVEYLLTKLFMNGGIHGKPITKTHRRKKLFDNDTRKVYYVEEDNVPELGFMVGFTAMQNARTRLAKHCRMVQEAGYKVMMCDTDSMVVNCEPEVLRGILGEDAFECGKEMRTNLGRFDFEDDSDMLKKLKKQGFEYELEVRNTFDVFKCWGLKKYAEGRVTEYGELFRKSAFAGMSDELQQELLMVWETDGTEYEWVQNGKKKGEKNNVICDTVKTGGAESIWYDPDAVKARGVRKSECIEAKNRFKEISSRKELRMNGTG